MGEMDFYIDTINNLPVPFEDSVTLKEKAVRIFYDFMQLGHLYDSAIKVVKTYLSILDDEFSLKFQRNPIHNIEDRLKSPQSIMKKLEKKGLPMTTEAAQKNLLDIAGIRVTCYYISDIYSLVEMLGHRDDFTIIKRKDYIKNPKPSGYRSYHLVVNVPVYMSSYKQYAPVEIQIRTMAMDFWASLEHQLKYKPSSAISPELSEELRQCAERIAETDIQMQQIYMEINNME